MFFQRYNVDIADLDIKSTKIIQGVPTELVVSPYNIPLNISARYSSTTSEFYIHFNFMSDEKCINEHVFKHVTVETGKNSKRLYSIKIDLDKISDFESKEPDVQSFIIYGIIMRVLELYQPSKQSSDSLRLSIDTIRDHWIDLLFNKERGFLLGLG